MAEPVKKEPIEKQHKPIKQIVSSPERLAADRIRLTQLHAASIANKENLKAEALKNIEPGQLVAGQGIYLGRYAPKDRDGNSLGKVFNVFAAPQDLPETMKYTATVAYIAKLKGWNGYDGTNYETDKEIYAALKDGSYNGGWIIPPHDLLIGTEPDNAPGIRQGKIIQPDNLFDHQNKGAFKNTFKIVASGNGYIFPDWYWSSTKCAGYLSDIYAAHFSNGNVGPHPKDMFHMSCRPVRLVEI